MSARPQVASEDFLEQQNQPTITPPADHMPMINPFTTYEPNEEQGLAGNAEAKPASESSICGSPDKSSTGKGR